MARLIWLALLFQSALCTRENIARNKTVYQSKTLYWAPPRKAFYNWSAEFAIDGKTEWQGNMCQCCSGVGYETNREHPWWEIDLGMVTRLGKIRVHGRHDEAGIHQLRGFKMYLSETTPYVNSSAPEPVYVNNVTKNQYKADKGKTSIVLGDMAARYVTIALPPRQDETLMVICEVEIYRACKDYEFEPDCTPCHCLAGPCNKSTGMCQTGCQSGWMGPACNIKCGVGTFGANCKSLCGYCFNETGCNIYTGECKHGCLAGFHQERCLESCMFGRYDRDCLKECGHCFHGGGCDRFNGTCEQGCEDGFQQPLCDKECEVGSFGPNCSKSCGECANGPGCNVSTGECEGGCQAGYNGMLCKTECTTGSFGPNCEQQCGKCLSMDGCNITNGECAGGCEAGYRGDLCNTLTSEYSVDKGSSVSTTIGFVVAAVSVMGIMLTIGFFLRKRRNKASTKGRPLDNTTEPDDNVDDSSPTGGTNNAITLLAVSSENRPGVEDPPEAVYAMPNKEKATPVHELWDLVQTQRGENFELLTSQFESLESGLLHKHEVGSRPENRIKHKYREMFAYDRNRVKLQVTRPGETDYINASIIDGFDRPGKFIASQGPIDAMVDDFWRMIWQQQTSIVVMLTNLVEGEKSKCIKYWPEEGEARTFGLVKVVLKSIDRVLDYDVRRMDVTYDGKKCRRVTQYHFKSWPDKDVPANAWCLVNFWRVVDEAACNTTPAPIVVHCSAGIGRTGTFIALDNTCCQGRQTGCVSPLTIVQALRQQRINMVQTKGQYVYLHEAVAEALLFGTDCVSVGQFEDMVGYMRQGSRLESQFQLIQKSVGNQINEADALYGNVSKRENDTDIEENHRLEPVLFQNYLKKNTFVLCNYPNHSHSEEAWTRLLAFRPMTIVTLPDVGTELSQSFGRRAPENIPVKFNEEHGCGSYTEVIFDVSLSTEPQASQRSMKVFEYCCWQAGCSIPDDTRSLLEMVRAIRLWQPTLADDKPIIIMCRDGFSRSGLVCALLSEIDRIECTDGQTNFVNTVKTLKATMKDVIQNYDQYRFCMDALLSYITKADEVYQNL